MIQIVQNSINEMTVTLTELVTIENPFFLFCFYDSEKNERGCVVLTDYILGCRADKFMLDEPNDFNFPRVGFYDYEVYLQDNGTNVDPSNSISLLESGRIQVIGQENSLTYDTNTARKVYQDGQ